MKAHTWMVWILCALLGACASQPKQRPRIAMQGFSIAPPGDKEWIVATQNPGLTVIGKTGRYAGQTFTIMATIVELPPAASAAELVRHVQSEQRKTLDSKRYRIFTHQVTQQAIQGQTCAVSRAEVAERIASIGTGSPVNMMVETLTLVCPHPKNPLRGINLSYTHRHFPEDIDPQFWQDGAARVQSLAFEPL